jgi:type IV secretion system protein TrbL
LVKTLLFAGFGLAFIIHGANWFHAIVQSFVDVGQKAANIPPVTPGTILADGLNVATQLINSASKIDNNLMGMIHPGVIGDLVGNPGLLIIIGLFAILIVLAFVIVAAEFIAIQVLMFIIFGVGVIMLGFSAFRPVASFAEKYFSAAIAIGTRLMVLYVIIGIGMGLAATWPSEVAASPTFFTLLMVLGQATVFGYLTVRIPSLAAGLLQGSLNTGGGEMLATAIGTGIAMASGTALAAGGIGAAGAASRQNPIIAAAHLLETGVGAGGSLTGTAARASGTSMPTGTGFGASSPNMGSAATPSPGAGPKPSSGGTSSGNPMPPPGNPNNIQPKFADSGPQNAKKSGSVTQAITAVHHTMSGVNHAADKTPTQGISPKFDTSRDE